jgi:hypothetical protein
MVILLFLYSSEQVGEGGLELIGYGAEGGYGEVFVAALDLADDFLVDTAFAGESGLSPAVLPTQRPNAVSDLLLGLSAGGASGLPGDGAPRFARSLPQRCSSYTPIFTEGGSRSSHKTGLVGWLLRFKRAAARAAAPWFQSTLRSGISGAALPWRRPMQSSIEAYAIIFKHKVLRSRTGDRPQRRHWLGRIE